MNRIAAAIVVMLGLSAHFVAGESVYIEIRPNGGPMSSTQLRAWLIDSSSIRDSVQALPAAQRTRVRSVAREMLGYDSAAWMTVGTAPRTNSGGIIVEVDPDHPRCDADAARRFVQFVATAANMRVIRHTRQSARSEVER